MFNLELVPNEFYLRRLSPTRIGGVIVPYHIRDKFRTWWTPNTDFMLTHYGDKKPLFWAHLFDEKYPHRAGWWNLFESHPEGLYSEADVDPSPTRDVIMQHIEDMNAGFSTGSIPHLIRIKPTGEVTRWPIIEASILPTAQLGSLPGTTTAHHIRSYLPEEETQSIQRSIFMFERTATQPDPEPEVEDNDPTILDGLEHIYNAIHDMNDNITSELRSAPTRQLTPSSDITPTSHRPDIQVRSKWDEVDLRTMLFYHEGARITRYSNRNFDEKFFRALMHKVEFANKQDENEISEYGHIRSAIPNIDQEAYDAVHQYVPYLRADEAMKATLANFGDELVPTLLNSVYWRDMYLSTEVMQNLTIVEATSNPWDYPVVTTGPTVRSVPELTDQTNMGLHNSIIPASKVGTDKITFNAGKIGHVTIFSEELFEDSVNIDALKAISEASMIAMAQASDEVIISGDESATITNISHDGVDPTGTAYDKILEMHGLRYMAHVADSGNDSVAHATISADSLITLQKLMGPRGIFGLNPKNLFAIVDPGVYYKFLALDAFESMNDLGPNATLLTGMVGAVKGVPLIISNELENTNAAGDIPSTHDATLGSFLVVNRKGVIVARRRAINIQAYQQPGADGRAVWATARFDVQQMSQGHVAYGYNTTV